MLQIPSVGQALYPFILILLCSYPASTQVVGTFVDDRDQQTYKIVTYSLVDAKQVFSDHDEYGTYLNGKPESFKVSFDDGMPSSMTWMAQHLNFEMPDSKCKYDSDANCKSYGRMYRWDAANNACPNGWHLPSDEEWFVLASLYDGVAAAGQHLKSTKLGGTNKSLFNVRKPSIFWSSSELDSTSALDWKVNFRWVKLQRWKGGKELYNSVRCVRDE